MGKASAWFLSENIPVDWGLIARRRRRRPEARRRPPSVRRCADGLQRPVLPGFLVFFYRVFLGFIERRRVLLTFIDSFLV